MLVEQILNRLGLSDNTFATDSNRVRRLPPRHPGTQAEVSIAGRTFSVRDWSMSNLFFDTPPDSRLIVGDKVLLEMTFRLPHETVAIEHPAMIIRTATRGAMVEFMPLTSDVRRKFERVIDGYHVQSFVESQVA
jgi:hypothetical protein